MTFTKDLENRDAQAVVEYILVFTVVAIAVIVVFKGINPETTGISKIFKDLIVRVRASLN